MSDKTIDVKCPNCRRKAMEATKNSYIDHKCQKCKMQFVFVNGKTRLKTIIENDKVVAP